MKNRNCSEESDSTLLSSKIPRWFAWRQQFVLWLSFHWQLFHTIPGFFAPVLGYTCLSTWICLKVKWHFVSRARVLEFQRLDGFISLLFLLNIQLVKRMVVYNVTHVLSFPWHKSVPWLESRKLLCHFTSENMAFQEQKTFPGVVEVPARIVEFIFKHWGWRNLFILVVQLFSSDWDKDYLCRATAVRFSGYSFAKWPALDTPPSLKIKTTVISDYSSKKMDYPVWQTKVHSSVKTTLNT